MLVETTASHASVEDAQDALAGLKNIPGFVLGYVVPGNPKTRLVFLCHCANGDAGANPKSCRCSRDERRFPARTTAFNPPSFRRDGPRKRSPQRSRLPKRNRLGFDHSHK